MSIHLSRRRLLIILIGFGPLILGLLWTAQSKNQTPIVTPSLSPSPSAQPALSAEDRATVDQLSRELAAKFYTYSRPDAPDYLQSIKPYLKDSFYAATKSELDRYRGRLTQAGSSAAQAGEIDFITETPDSAKVTVRVTITSQRGTTQETPEIQWRKFGDRWTAEYILTELSQQNKEKYVE